MKIMTISRTKDSYIMLPAAMALRIVEGTDAFVNKYRKAGKCKEIYNAPGLKMTVSIWEMESAEELTRLFLENPMYPFMEVESYILGDWDSFIKVWKETVERRYRTGRARRGNG